MKKTNAETVNRWMHSRNWKHLGDEALRFPTSDRCDIFCIRKENEVEYVRHIEAIKKRSGIEWCHMGRYGKSYLRTDLSVA